MLKNLIYFMLIFGVNIIFTYSNNISYTSKDSFGGKVYSKIAGINNYAYTTPGLSIISVNQDFTLTGSILDFLQGYKSGSGHIVFDTWEKYILYTESMVSGSQKYSVYLPENITQYDIRSLLQGDQNNISSDIYSSAPENTLITTTPYINVINSLGLSSSNGGSSSSSSSSSASSPIGGTINKDITAPVVNLIGGSIVNIFLGSLYSELGAQWTDIIDGSGTIVSASSGSVNTSVLGSYVLSYLHTDVAGNTGSIIRTINVINIPDTTPPTAIIEYSNTGKTNGTIIATLTGMSESIIITNNSGSGVYIFTNNGSFTFNFSDGAGNTGSTIANVTNIDTTPPVITLIGSGVVNVLRGFTFMDGGATWIDTVDGSGTIVSATSGSVDTNVLGSYTLTYSHTDVAGNTGSITRTVNVITGNIPVITLIGSGTITVPFGSNYIDAGATATDLEDGDLTTSIVVNNTVNTGAIGLYMVTYDVLDTQMNSAIRVTRMVNVVTGVAPVITLVGSGTITVPFGSGYTDLGATASDVEDGDLTSSIVVNNTVNTGIVGNYTVTYDVTDAQMNQAVRVTRVVNVVDTVPPVITLVGSGIVNVYLGSTYIDSGATWTDIVDGGGTIPSATSGSVNVFLTGTYTLSYTHTDVAGNVGIPVTRLVNVVPFTTLIGNKMLPGRDNACIFQIGSDFISNTSPDYSRVTPSDCHIIKTQQPVFSWPQPANKKSGTLWHIVVKKNGITQIEDDTSNAFYTSKILLSPDTYEWIVSYTNTSNATITSLSRHFTIPSNADTFFIPGSDMALTTAKSRTHPRIIPESINKVTFESKVLLSDYKQEYNKYISMASGGISAPLPSESINASIIRNERYRIESLAYAYMFTGDTKYRAPGIAGVMNFASWSATGITNENNFLINRQIYTALAIGYDAYYADLSPAQKTIILDQIKIRIKQAVDKYDFSASPHQGPGMSALFMSTQAMAYVVGEPGMDEMDNWFKNSWETLTSVGLNLGGEDDGGYFGSMAYAWYTLVINSESVSTLYLITDINLAKNPWMSRELDFLMAMTSPITPARELINAYGDGLEDPNLFGNYAFNYFRLLSLLTSSMEHVWYWQKDALSISNSLGYYISALHFIVDQKQGSLPLTPTAPTKKTNLFEDAGIIAMFDDPSKTKRSVVTFKSSSYGSYSHSHADQNSFTFVSHGENMLINAGYYDSYLSAHHALEGNATFSKNSLTFDGGLGQGEKLPLTATPQIPLKNRNYSGEFINFYNDESRTMITGDATKAYRGATGTGLIVPHLNKVIRSLGYDRDAGIIIVYDYANSSSNKRWELNFHGLSPFIETQTNTVKITHNGVSACMEIFNNSGTLNSSSGFINQPMVKNGSGVLIPKIVPDEYHVRFFVDTPSTEFKSITIIREDCNTNPVNVTFSGTEATVNIQSRIYMFDREKIGLDK